MVGGASGVGEDYSEIDELAEDETVTAKDETVAMTAAIATPTIMADESEQEKYYQKGVMFTQQQAAAGSN